MSHKQISRRQFISSLALGTGCVALSSPMALLTGCAANPSADLSYLDKAVSKGNVSTVYKWTDVMLQAIRNQGITPPPASRSLAMGHMAGFLAINGVEGQYNTSYNIDAAPQGTNAEIAYGVAVATAAQDAFNASFYFDKSKFLDQFPNGSGKTAAIKYGEYVGKQVVKSRVYDGAEPNKANFYLGRYPRRKDALKWSPTGPFYGAEAGPFLGTFNRGLFPGWGAQKPWVMKNKQDFRAQEFPDHRSPEFAEQFHKIKAMGVHNSTIRTIDQTEIAFFWEDGPRGATPPGHFQIIAMKVLQGRNYSLLEQARLFAMLSMGQADAAITTWDSKYAHDIVRPETSIRFRADDFDNPLIKKSDAQSNWRSLIFTPDFPAYTSGHSVFGAVSARIIANFIGTDSVPFTLNPPDLVNWPRQLGNKSRAFTGLWEAAEENGLSRIYGGVHWDHDNIEGLNIGKRLADYVYNNAFVKRA